MKDEGIAVHPVQVPNRYGRKGVCPQVVTMRAYEVYCHVYGGQQALVSGDCRGGFSCGELIAFLYAYPFPKQEWRLRVGQAIRGMDLD